MARDGSTPKTGGPTRLRKPRGDALRGKVRAHDPFELIRWLALSQPDPRKALAELVQNSLDAGATKVQVTRVRERGVPCLKIFDDGEGVIPEMGRIAALKYIATHIGHSRKRALSPQQRLTLMTQGQYGIGLLGFWSLGERLEMRTAVQAQRPHRLVLQRDRPDFVIEELRGRLPLSERWTEVVVAELHREAQGALGGRRAADYLAAELRGQLLARDVELTVVDRMARGRAPKQIVVRPPRFLGERLEGIGPVEVPGYPPIRLEIHLAGEPSEGSEPRGLAVYAAGTLVVEGFDELTVLGLDHPPWTDHRLNGLVDFPALRVVPGSRRGVFVDAGAGAFAAALTRVEPILTGVLDALERRREEELDQTLIRDLQRAFRHFYRHRPRYALLPVRRIQDEGVATDQARANETPVGAVATTDGIVETAPAAPGTRTRPAQSDLLPPGPLDSLRLSPAIVRIEIGGQRQARAVGLDAAGRPVAEPPVCDWRIEGGVGILEPRGDGASVVITAAAEAGEGWLEASTVANGRSVSARARIEVSDEAGVGRASEGIPEPELAHYPGAPWRSRMWDGRWQVNTGHRDYRGVADRPRLKLRYLAGLFAKEVVLRSSQDPRLERPLEQVVEVATYADRNLAARRPRRGRPSSKRIDR